MTRYDIKMPASGWVVVGILFLTAIGLLLFRSCGEGKQEIKPLSSAHIAPPRAKEVVSHRKVSPVKHKRLKTKISTCQPEAIGCGAWINVIYPDGVVEIYTADEWRIYEMY